jgi:phosphoribosylglycinamide formyltransferase-1
MKRKLAIFASGSGTNAKNIIAYFEDHESIEVRVLVCNNPRAKVLDIASEMCINNMLITNEQADDGNFLVEEMRFLRVDYIVLAGYLRKIPQKLIKIYPNRILNIHPSLLPKFGGKGMYGKHVHEAVLANEEVETGITIHWVNEDFDSGKILAQYVVPLTGKETAKVIQNKVHQLELQHFPQVIENAILNHEAYV